MRFRRVLAGVLTAGFLLTGCNNAPDPVRDAAYEVARSALEQQLMAGGLKNVVVLIEKESDETQASVSPTATNKATGTPKPGASASGKAGTPSASPSASTVTYDILSATFDIPGLTCRGNVEQRLTPPVGMPYFDEVILPDGTEVEVAKEARGALNLTTIFDYVFKFPQCQVAGVTAPPTVPAIVGSGPEG